MQCCHVCDVLLLPNEFPHDDNKVVLYCIVLYAGSFRVWVIHRTLTWTTGSLTRVRDHSYSYLYTRGLGTQTACEHNLCDSEKLSQLFLVLLTQAGLEPPVFGIFDLESDTLPTEPPRHPFTVDWALKTNYLSISAH